MRTGICTSGFAWSELSDLPGEPASERLAGMLTRMRSDGFFSILLFHVPDDVDMHKGGWWETCDQFLQSAGSADRMTVEVRRWEGDRYVHDAIARPGAQRHDPVESSERIVFGRHELWVDPAEVFDAATAAPLYEHYRQTGHVPDDYTLRELDLTWPPAT